MGQRQNNDKLKGGHVVTAAKWNIAYHFFHTFLYAFYSRLC